MQNGWSCTHVVDKGEEQNPRVRCRMGVCAREWYVERRGLHMGARCNTVGSAWGAVQIGRFCKRGRRTLGSVWGWVENVRFYTRLKQRRPRSLGGEAALVLVRCWYPVVSIFDFDVASNCLWSCVDYALFVCEFSLLLHPYLLDFVWLVLGGASIIR